MRGFAIILILLAQAAASTARGGEAVLLDEQAFGLVPIEGDFDKVVVSKLKGTLNIHHGEKPDEVRFSSYSGDPKREPLPVAVWSEGRTLRFEPTAIARAQEYALDIFLCDGMDVALDLEGSQVSLAGLPKGLDVHGTGLVLKVAGVRGRATFDLVGGSAILGGVGARLEARGKDVNLTVTDAPSEVTLHLVGGKARVTGATSGLQADTQGTSMAIESSVGLTVTAAQGRVDLVDSGDAELTLSGASVNLTRVRGLITIETDAAVKISESTAVVRIDATGGSIRGASNSGGIEIRARNTDIGLEHISGPLRIEGESLKVRLLDLVSESAVNVRRSDVDVEGNQRLLNVDSSDGNVNVRAALARTSIRALGGNLALVDLRASVELHADVADALVSFAVLPNDDDSVLDNAGGGLQVHLPEAGSGRIEARTKGGLIESDLDAVVVNDERTTATGLIGSGGGRTINVQASWNIRLTGEALSASPR